MPCSLSPGEMAYEAAEAQKRRDKALQLLVKMMREVGKLSSNGPRQIPKPAAAWFRKMLDLDQEALNVSYNDITVMLCSMCYWWERHVSLPLPSRAIVSWWREHEDGDKQRRAQVRREAQAGRLRASGLAKLTDAERVALGLS